MNRKEYNTCMAPFMKGGGEDRKLRFCIGAKLCSSKAKSEAEAEQLCINQPAKEPRPRKSRSGRGIIAPDMLACIAANLEIENLTTANLSSRLEVAAAHCTVGKGSTKPLTYKRFMSSCIKETSEGGDFIHSQPDIKRCQTKWNAIRGS